MITMTAILRPVDLLRSSPVLGQNPRRHYEHTRLFTGQMFVVIPGLGAVLVTEKRHSYLFDIVGDDQAAVDRRVATLEAVVREKTNGEKVRFLLEKASQIPVPFR
ncbi:hypothetical protein [Cryobacterium sp. MLB-32]|uniref:hypothetical protein n=1 Tax=Cryobacterium sp. MLB-32 TaxID=1529318 RepID=UPI0012E01B89|nr:hypothetical protein [Cryobacterium sp. MLB-32]